MALRVQQLPDVPGSRLADPRVWVATLGIAAIGLGGLIVRDLYFPATAATGAVRTVTVGTGTVRSVVSGTGNVVPSSQQFVAFRIAGQLTEVDVKVGDKVTAGQVLAKIDTTPLQAAVDTATANLATAQANLDSVSTPLTAEQYAQLQHNLANAQQSYGDTTAAVNVTNQQDAANVATDQQQLAADQSQQQADQNALNTSPSYQFDRQKLAADQQKLNSDLALYSATCPATTPAPPVGSCATAAVIQADQATVAADNQKVAQDQAQVNADNAKVAADSTKLSADQAKQQSDATSGTQRINSAQAAITSAQDAINVQSTVKPSALAQAQAGVANAQTALDTAITNLGYATLTAPAAGVILNINGQPGESVGATTGVTAQSPGSTAPLTTTTNSSAFMVLSSDGAFQAQAPFAETDASKIAAKQQAVVTFDAIAGLAVPAHVLAVAPNSTTTSNVVNYLVTFTLDRTDPRIRSGMTANLTVIVNQVANVLNVVNSAIHRSGRTTYVTVLRNGRRENVDVTIGQVGDTTTEIVAGLSAGDKVVLPTVSIGSGSNRGGGGGLLGPGGGGSFGPGRG